jgi:hypothetical protein
MVVVDAFVTGIAEAKESFFAEDYLVDGHENRLLSRIRARRDGHDGA